MISSMNRDDTGRDGLNRDDFDRNNTNMDDANKDDANKDDANEDDANRDDANEDDGNEDGANEDDGNEDGANEDDANGDDAREGDFHNDANKLDTNTHGTVDMECKLLTLPRELRDQIYRYILVSELPLEEVYYLYAESCRSVEEGRDDRASRNIWKTQMSMYPRLIDTRIMRANHQLYAESLEVLLKGNTFILKMYPGGMFNHSFDWSRAAQIQTTGWYVRFTEDMRRFVGRLQFLISMLGLHSKALKSLQIEMSVPSRTWVEDHYGVGQEMREVLDALKDVRVDAKVKFKIGFRHPDWSLSYDPGTKGEALFVDGMMRLGKVMNRSLNAADFEWPIPQYPRRKLA
ncbi:RNA-binding protein [Venturia nashicola]|nr:RNA-binding protein [Venturia nashicola]